MVRQAGSLSIFTFNHVNLGWRAVKDTLVRKLSEIQLERRQVPDEDDSRMQLAVLTSKLKSLRDNMVGFDLSRSLLVSASDPSTVGNYRSEEIRKRRRDKTCQQANQREAA
jgi:hypothetical protein